MTGPKDPLVRIEALRAGYVKGGRVALAVRDVDLDVAQGEFLGIAGESGCGKSTLAFAMTGLLQPPGRVFGGKVWFAGTDLMRLDQRALRRLRWKEFSIVFQASMNVLNPVARVKDQIFDAMIAHGVRDRRRLHERVVELFELVNLPLRFMDAYPHQLSGGMRQRVAIAAALALEPRLVIMDEPTTALDVVVQRTILQEIDQLRRRLGFSVVFITHDLSLLVEMSDSVAIMYAGEIVERAPSRRLYASPKHPYTRSLMQAFPPLTGPRRRLSGIAGQPPDLTSESPGCPFAPRCSQRVAGVCERVRPRLRQVEDGHWVACHLHE